MKSNKVKRSKLYLNFFVAAIVVAVILCGLALNMTGKGSEEKESKKKMIEVSSSKKTSLKRAKFEGSRNGAVFAADSIVMRMPVLMYHYVEHIKDSKDVYRSRMNIPPDVFEKELESLKAHGYTSLFIKDVASILTGEKPECAKAVALTFDDGYADFYTDVFPLLKKHQMKATVFIIGNYIGQPDFLNEGQIKELIASGLVEIGSHTMDHLMLDKVDHNEAARQIKISKEYLERRFGIEVKSFAYPFGHYNEQVIKAVIDAGYTAAVTTKLGSYQSPYDLFVLERLRPEKIDKGDIGASLSSLSD